MEKLNFIDLFCGAGGLSCGLEMAGMRCLLGVDNRPHAIQSFATNHKEAQAYDGPIEELTFPHLKKALDGKTVHAVVGGPPCQGFSTVGRGDPNDNRNHLFLQFVKIVETVQPYFIVMENVTGLVAQKNEATLRAIFDHFHQLNYSLDIQVMSAHQYGVPQKRRRTIIIGTRINEAPRFPAPHYDTTTTPQYRPAITVGEALANLKSEDGTIYNHDLKKARIKSQDDKKRLRHIPEGKGVRYQQDEENFLPPRLRLGLDWPSLPEGRLRQCRYQRLNRQLPSPTILTSRHTYYHPVETRYLTAREAAKLQSFPNDFIFKGTLASQWRQIGNAVPPLLGKAIGQTLQQLYREADPQRVKGKIKRPKSTDLHYIRGKAFVYKA